MKPLTQNLLVENEEIGEPDGSTEIILDVSNAEWNEANPLGFPAQRRWTIARRHFRWQAAGQISLLIL